MENTAMLSRVPVRVPVNQRSTDKCTAYVSQEAGDIDEAVYGRRPGVWWRLEDEGVEDVDAYYPGECECCCQNGEDDLWIHDQWSQEEFEQREVFGQWRPGFELLNPWFLGDGV
jgi:hypothetical protein